VEADRYGYELSKEVRNRSEGEYEIKEPSLYSALRRLEKELFVTAYWSEQQSKGARRKYYSITDDGRMYYEHLVQEWITVKRIIDKIIGGRIYASTPDTMSTPTQQAVI
jgi:PadR family transcriptional regulator PadR